MRTVLILAVFGMLFLQPRVSSAQAYLECVTGCTNEKASSDAACAKSDDEARAQCRQDNQDAMKSCIDGCQQDARANAPADGTKDRPVEAPKEIPDTLKDN